MSKINLDEYKNFIINTYKYKYDARTSEVLKRKTILNSKYSDESLQSVIDSTYNFANFIIKNTENNNCEYLNIPVVEEPATIDINLNIIGGGNSDTIWKYSGFLFSMILLKEIFGPMFYIEPNEVDIIKESDNSDYDIVFLKHSYSIYLQFTNSIIENAKIRLEKEHVLKLINSNLR